MKTYKNVEMFAKNAPTGSYAAGCPEHTHHSNNNVIYPGQHSGTWGCYKCEVAA